MRQFSIDNHYHLNDNSSQIINNKKRRIK